MYSSLQNVLQNYFIDLNNLELINNKILKTNLEIKKIESDINNNNFSLYSNIKSTNYTNTKVQKSAYIFGFEDNVCKAIERKENKLLLNLNYLQNLQEHKRNIEINISNLDFFINNLDAQQQNFIRFKYKNKKSLEYIAFKLNISKTTAYRINNNILKSLDIFIKNLN